MKYNFKIIKAIPLILFFSIVLVSGLVLYQVKYNSKDVRVIKSQLIGKNIPLISIPEVNYKKINQENINLNLSNFKGKIFAINFFASWCAPCRIEAPIIEELSLNIPIIGVAYKDKFLDTINFLNNYGNPYTKTGIDNKGKIAIEWGVYGVPETFLINADGKIIYRHAGPLLYDVYKTEILPLIKKNIPYDKKN